ncbi:MULTISPECIES: SDR family oxidoreductase [unclassified Streptomyces]|uniref:SDR family NAD(P)-dependent oxidoreductase n=1 Tax=unclassified Streptomyces TaxID=2593676 RepID=UPI000DC7B69B|nr:MULTISPECIES: SDR family oxidoreductase [unclassified Streptomyces]AWZ10496.1 short-chain dehydrogenase [Streptomyces sp. ICC4]AWZ17859.1 short-chain dehydrogenase [Streptomyces sp. ICC1]
MKEQTGLLTGRRALITGASSGIGAAAARVFCEQGASVLVTARREEELVALTRELTDQGHTADYAVADVSRGEEVERAVARAVELFGGLDAAFNNAGLGTVPEPLHLTPDADFEAVMATNVLGTWNCMKHEIAAMLPGGGAIVNNSSVAGLVGTPAGAPYIASKHAVIGLTKAACGYAAQGIRVNAIAPGTTRSEMMGQWFDLNPGLEEHLHSRAPLPRTADPREIAYAAAWLLSDQASFVVGATVPVDGGWTAR